jgi:hypothetical protein
MKCQSATLLKITKVIRQLVNNNSTKNVNCAANFHSYIYSGTNDQVIGFQRLCVKNLHINTWF